jgi:hypothetical protein
MPDIGPLGRGGARRRTRRRMSAVNEAQQSQEEPENEVIPANSDKLEKLAKLLKDKGVITESEYNLIFD